MKKYLLSILFFGILMWSCSKDESQSYEYWSALVNEKYQEINQLTQSVACGDFNDFELVRKNGYYLVHPSIEVKFDQLMKEVDRLQTEAGKLLVGKESCSPLMQNPIHQFDKYVSIIKQL